MVESCELQLQGIHVKFHVVVNVKVYDLSLVTCHLSPLPRPRKNSRLGYSKLGNRTLRRDRVTEGLLQFNGQPLA